jgi:type II secretory pathway pseudopilin PulG
MTLLEIVVASVIFSMVLLVAYAALQSTRNFTRTNTTQVELQEEARHALESITEKLQAAGRFTYVPNGMTYPKIFKDNSYPPNPPYGYSNANKHPAKSNPKAKPGSNANGGDPRGQSDEIIFRIPQLDANGTPVLNAGSIVWSTQEYGFFIAPAGDGTNNVEFRDSSVSQQQLNAGQPVQGDIVCRFVDRIQIEDYATDPSNLLTLRQLRVTLYLTRVLDPANPDKQIIVALSTIVDMRNTQQLD